MRNTRNDTELFTGLEQTSCASCLRDEPKDPMPGWPLQGRFLVIGHAKLCSSCAGEIVRGHAKETEAMEFVLTAVNDTLAGFKWPVESFERDGKRWIKFDTLDALMAFVHSVHDCVISADTGISMDDGHGGRKTIAGDGPALEIYNDYRE